MYTGLRPEFESPQHKTNYVYDHIALASHSASNVQWHEFDIEKELGFTLPVKNQGSSSSCVGQAAATYAYVLNSIELRRIYFSKTKEVSPELSARSVYSQIAQPFGGAYMGDAFRLMVKGGLNKEQDVPSYENGLPPTEQFMTTKDWKTSLLEYKAKNYQGKEYRFIRNTYSIDLVAQAIVENNGCLLGVYVGRDSSWLGSEPRYDEYRGYSHLVYAGKLRVYEGKRWIGILNSWGENIGERGWQWLSEDFFVSGGVHTAGVMIDKPNSVLVWILDKNGKPRAFPTSFVKTIAYLLGRNYTLVDRYDFDEEKILKS